MAYHTGVFLNLNSAEHCSEPRSILNPDEVPEIKSVAKCEIFEA